MLTPIRSNIQISSISQHSRARFAPQERLPVPGKPRAESSRPENPPGVIPVGNAGQELPDTQATDITQQVDRQKKQDLDFQIIDRVLNKEHAEGKAPHKHSDKDSLETAPNHGRHRANLAGPQPQDAFSSRDGNNLGTDSAGLPSGQPAQASQQPSSLKTNADKTPEPVTRADPLAFDLDGNGLQTTGIDHSVSFDINGDGIADQTSFIAQGDGFLALDRNHNGSIDSGLELFGDQHGALNGYEELRKFDENHDNKIDAADEVFSQLTLLSLNAVGEQQMQSLSQAGIRSISLDYQNTAQALNAYDRVSQAGSFEKEDGTSGSSADVMLGFKTSV